MLKEVCLGVFEMNSKSFTIFISLNNSLHISSAEECYVSLLVTQRDSKFQFTHTGLCSNSAGTL